LKANYPWHFAAALLSIEAANTDKLALYLGECRERGIPILPPDINESQLRFTVEPGAGVRFGLAAIKNVGEGAIASLIDVRTRRGRIQSLHDLCEELDLRLANKRVFESLVKAGAFDSLAQGDATLKALSPAALRPRLFAAIDAAFEHGARCQRDKEEGQAQLFGNAGTDDAPQDGGLGPVSLPLAPEWNESTQLANEKETLGLYWSGHPVDRYASELRAFGARSTGELAEVRTVKPRGDAWGPGGPKPIEPDTAIGGIVSACRQLKTRKGERMAVFTLEDSEGSVEIIAFPEAYRKAGPLLDPGTLILVRGKLERDDESSRILASEVLPIDRIHEQLAQEVAIRVRNGADRATFEALGEIFSRHRGDRRVSFEIELPSDARRLRVKAALSAAIRVQPSSSLVAEVERVVGQGAVLLR
jgi:DNA polymerase-3 subunit alpha